MKEDEDEDEENSFLLKEDPPLKLLVNGLLLLENPELLPKLLLLPVRIL